MASVHRGFTNVFGMVSVPDPNRQITVFSGSTRSGAKSPPAEFLRILESRINLFSLDMDSRSGRGVDSCCSRDYERIADQHIVGDPVLRIMPQHVVVDIRGSEWAQCGHHVKTKLDESMWTGEKPRWQASTVGSRTSSAWFRYADPNRQITVFSGSTRSGAKSPPAEFLRILPNGRGNPESTSSPSIWIPKASGRGVDSCCSLTLECLSRGRESRKTYPRVLLSGEGLSHQTTFSGGGAS